MSRAIASQSALPEYRSAAVRPCRATAETPALRAVSAASRKVVWSASMPLRIFTVTGIPPREASVTAVVTMASNRSCFHGRAEPPPLRVTLGTGQPKLRSMWSARSSSTSIRTAWPMVIGSTP